MLVLANAKSAVKDCPDQAQIRYMPAAGGVLTDQTISNLHEELRIHTGSVSLTDYDFEKPATSLLTSLAGELPGEDYDFPGKYTSKSDGDRYARIRLEEKEVQLLTVRGQSNCMPMRSGYKFKLIEHARDAANQEYTVLRVEHTGRNTSYQAGNPSPFEYSNRFEAIPHSVPFRPPRIARKPTVNGSQTAVVVGKAGEEIWTDQYGRVKVHFFWDRLGTYDQNESCWIRVPTAGPASSGAPSTLRESGRRLSSALSRATPTAPSSRAGYTTRIRCRRIRFPASRPRAPKTPEFQGGRRFQRVPIRRQEG